MPDPHDPGIARERVFEHREALDPQQQTGKRRVVVVMRERGGITFPFVFKSEVHRATMRSAPA